MKLDVDFVRSQFPAFEHEQSRDWAFFENAGGAYACRQVIDRLLAFMTEYKVQPYGPFELSRIAGREMDAGYETIAGLLNTHVDNVTLGPSTTANMYVLAQALRHGIAPGDEIVVTNQDHEANIGCWRRLGEFGARIREWKVDGRGELHTSDLEALVNERTRLVCFTLASNIMSTLNPVKEIVSIAKRHGAMVVGDAVSYAPHDLPDVESSGIDFLLFSTYKVFATHVGVMWGRTEALARTRNQGHYFNDEKPHYRLNPAGPMHAEIAALAGLREYFDTLHAQHFDLPEASLHARAAAVCGLFREHEARLAKQLIDGLNRLPGLRVLGHGSDALERRSSVVSVISERMRPSVLAERLGERRVAVRNGHFYALRLIEALGVDPAEGVLRISMVHYNTEGEVDRLLGGLAELLE